MTPLAEVAARILARPAPVIVSDTCSLLDLFRVARPTKEAEERRIEVEELKAASKLLAALTLPEPPFHHVVPELVPGEFRDNAEIRVTDPFRRWVDAHDAAGGWIPKAVAAAGLDIVGPIVVPIGPQNLPAQFRDFAMRLLGTATILARDLPSLLRAVERVIGKRRPSHKKEMKDSMNLEQMLALARLLSESVPFPHPIVFVSSNTKDFAAANGIDIHPDLKADFDTAGLLYRTSFRSALGLLVPVPPGS